MNLNWVECSWKFLEERKDRSTGSQTFWFKLENIKCIIDFCIIFLKKSLNVIKCANEKNCKLEKFINTYINEANKIILNENEESQAVT